MGLLFECLDGFMEIHAFDLIHVGVEQAVAAYRKVRLACKEVFECRVIYFTNGAG